MQLQLQFWFPAMSALPPGMELLVSLRHSTFELLSLLQHMELPSCSVPSQSLLNHSPESSGKGSRVTQSPGWNPPSPPPRQIPQPESSTIPIHPEFPGEQERSPGSDPGRRDSHSTWRFPVLPWTTPFLTQPISSTRSSKVSHPQICSQTLWRAGKSSSAPSQQPESPHPSSLQAGRFGSAQWEAWRRDSIHGMLWGTQQWDCPKLLGAGKGSMS